MNLWADVASQAFSKELQGSEEVAVGRARNGGKEVPTLQSSTHVIPFLPTTGSRRRLMLFKRLGPIRSWH